VPVSKSVRINYRSHPAAAFSHLLAAVAGVMLSPIGQPLCLSYVSFGPRRRERSDICLPAPAAGCGSRFRLFLPLVTARQDYARLASVNMASAVISTSLMLVLIIQFGFRVPLITF
jgi:hypothetical protein